MDDLIDFAMKFVDTARRFAHEYPAINRGIFSSRQALAITSMGTAKIMRTNDALRQNDLIILSVITSPPEAQKYAEYIALKILYGDLEIEETPEISKVEEVHEEEEIIDVHEELTGAQLLLNDIMNFLNLEKSVDAQTTQEVIDFIEETEENLFSQKERSDVLTDQEKLELARKRLAFEIVGGREGMISHNLSSWEEVFKVAKFLIMQSIPEISNKEMTYGQLLGYSDDIASTTLEHYIEIMANLLYASELHDIKEIQSEMNDIEETFSYMQLLNGYQLLEEYQGLLIRVNVPENFYAPILKEIIQQFENMIKKLPHTIEDYLNQPHLFDPSQFTDEKLEEILDNSLENIDDMLGLIAEAEEFDRQFDTNMSERAMIRFQDEEFEYEDLLQNAMNSPNWMELMEESIDEKLNTTSQLNDLEQLLEDFQKLTEKIDNSHLERVMRQKTKKTASKMIKQADDFQTLENVIDQMRKMGIKPNFSEIKNRGEKIGLTPNEIAQLMGNYFDYLKSMTTDKKENTSFERADQILKKFIPSSQQFNELTQLSFKHEKEGVLGALASRDLKKVANNMPPGKGAEELLTKALGAGAGENLLMEWFKSGKRLPKKIREIVKRAARRVMIDLAKAKAASLIGSSEAGPLPEGTIRPYVKGDDLDLIDIEESLDNILSSGKHLKDVVAEDFIVRKTVSGRRCVVFLIDISGSMSGAPLACASLAAAMLLMAFSRDELGLALFESNTHVLCKINEEIEIDEIVDEVLELTAEGGTQMSKAVEWARDQFLLSKSMDKMFVMVTDAGIYDFDSSINYIEEIADMGATSVMILPHNSYGLGNIQSKLDRSNTQLLTVKNWREFPELVSEVLSRT